MMKSLMHFALALLVTVVTGYAQPFSTKLDILPSSKLWLEGTSTLHDYKAETSKLRGTILAQVAEPSKIENFLPTTSIEIPVKTLKSGDKKLDANMYDALKEDDFHSISYRMLSATKLNDTTGGENKRTLFRTNGILTVAGKEQEIAMDVSVASDSTIRVAGSKELLMTDFGIEPPTMMLGLIKTDNRIVIKFDLSLRPNKDNQPLSTDRKEN